MEIIPGKDRRASDKQYARNAFILGRSLWAIQLHLRYLYVRIGMCWGKGKKSACVSSGENV